MPANPALRFIAALNSHDIEGVRASHHPDFEMIVPQHPYRGFRGIEQEVKNIAAMFAAHPDLKVKVLRMVELDPEVWIETQLLANDLEMAAVMIYDIDPDTDTLLRGRFYSEKVDRSSASIDEFIEDLREARAEGSA